MGTDRRPSTSKFQFFLWTVAVLFSYVAIWAVRVWNGQSIDIDMPPNLLLAMGFSITTVSVAKAVTTAYVSTGKLEKPPGGAADTASGPGALVQDDDGFTDLSKVQMMAWTVVAVVVFLVGVVQQIPATKPELPDIGGALMVLMGLGQGAYLGKKLVTTNVPRLTGLNPGGGKPGDPITISGEAFADSQGGSLITLDGFPMSQVPTAWSDKSITLSIPALYPGPVGSGPIGPGNYPTDHPVQVGLYVNGQKSANELPLTVK